MLFRKKEAPVTRREEILSGLQNTFAPERIVPQVALAATLGVASQVGAEITAKVIRGRHRKQWGELTPEQISALAGELAATSDSLSALVAEAEAEAAKKASK